MIKNPWALNTDNLLFNGQAFFNRSDFSPFAEEEWINGRAIIFFAAKDNEVQKVSLSCGIFQDLMVYRDTRMQYSP